MVYCHAKLLVTATEYVVVWYNIQRTRPHADWYQPGYATLRRWQPSLRWMTGDDEDDVNTGDGAAMILR